MCYILKGGDFMHRKGASKSYDRKVFSATADRVHKKNLQSVPMRGGFRL